MLCDFQRRQFKKSFSASRRKLIASRMKILDGVQESLIPDIKKPQVSYNGDCSLTVECVTVARKTRVRLPPFALSVVSRIKKEKQR